MELADPGGGRWITAVAVDSQGLLSQPSAVLIPGKPIPHGTLRAVLVGVDVYEDKALPRLAYARADAKRFGRALETSEHRTVRTVRATQLVDAKVTPARVLAVVKAAAEATEPDDTLVIFYAGHGVDSSALGQTDPGLVLTTPTTRMDKLKSTALPWSALADALANVHGAAVIVLDACHAGIAGSNAFTSNEDVVSSLITRAGSPIVVLAAAKGRQSSIESKQVGGGLLTAAVADTITQKRTTDALQQSAGLIALSELYTVVRARVMKETHGKQTPWLARNFLVGEIALF